MNQPSLRNLARSRIHEVPTLVRAIPTLVESTRARKHLAKGPTIGKLPVGDIAAPGFDWINPPVPDRSWQFRLHSWEYFVPWLESYVDGGDDKDVTFCLDGALNWWSQVEAAPEGEVGMAWYDMSVGGRAPILAVLILIASDRDDIDDQEFAALLRCAQRHQEVFARAEIFNPRTNHGFFLSIGQTSFASILTFMTGMAATAELGRQRLLQMATTQFLDDGGHGEHSPSYHYAMLGVFNEALEHGHITDETVRSRVRSAAAALGGMIQPDGSLVQLGDTRAAPMTRADSHSVHPETDWILSQGHRGVAPSTRVMTLPDTGYIFVRSPKIETFEDFQASSYLAVQAGFHGRAHKHADDLSFVWWVRGEQVLIDPGRYMYGDNLPADSPLRVQGYYYQDPYRQYVESTRAHSTVEVDNAIQRRRRTPFGSALVGVEQRDDSVTIRCRAPQQGYVHDRTWVVGADDSLVVTDHVTSDDHKEHLLRQWWQFVGTLGLLPAGNSVRLLFVSGRQVTMEQDYQLSGLQIGRGLTDPYRGHASPQDRMREPAWTLDWSATYSSSITVVTRFTVQAPA